MEGQDPGTSFVQGEDADAPRAVIGWVPHALPHGLELRIQSTRSSGALSEGAIETCRLVMTRNQALLLARSLLQSTDQVLDEPQRPRGVFGRIANAFSR